MTGRLRRYKCALVALILAGGVLCTTGCSSEEVGSPTFNIADWVYSSEEVLSRVTVDFPYYDGVLDENGDTTWSFPSSEGSEEYSNFYGKSHSEFKMVSMYLGAEGGDSRYSTDPISDYSSYLISYISKYIVYPLNGAIDFDIEGYTFTPIGNRVLGGVDNSVDIIYIDEEIPYKSLGGVDDGGRIWVKGYISKGYYSKFFGYIGKKPDDNTVAYIDQMLSDIIDTAKVSSVLDN